MPSSLHRSGHFRFGLSHCRAGKPQLRSGTVSPAWEHVNLTGDYLWENKPTLDENGFRAIARFVLRS
jgi:hypothetical protein